MGNEDPLLKLSNMEDHVVKSTQLSTSIRRIRRDKDIDDLIEAADRQIVGEDEQIVEGGWGHVQLGHESVIPNPSDQGNKGLCIVFALYHILLFQTNLLRSNTRFLDDQKPDFDYMLLVFKKLKDKCIHEYLLELMRVHILDKEEKRRVFSVNYDVNIDPKYDRKKKMKVTREAIKRHGGVIIEYEVRDEKSMGAEGEKKQKDLGHAVFAYGWRREGTQRRHKIIFLCLDSSSFGDGGDGYAEFSDLKSINQIYIPQLRFNKSGFKVVKQ